MCNYEDTGDVLNGIAPVSCSEHSHRLHVLFQKMMHVFIKYCETTHLKHRFMDMFKVKSNPLEKHGDIITSEPMTFRKAILEFNHSRKAKILHQHWTLIDI